MKRLVSSVGAYLALISLTGLSIALTLVGKKLNIEPLIKLRNRVRFAAMILLQERIEALKPVRVVAVESSEQKTEVYNLTLDSHNVYYANGVLSENCADSVMMCMFSPKVTKAKKPIKYPKASVA